MYYVSVNKQLISCQNYLGVLSRLRQGKGYKTFSYFKSFCGQGSTVLCASRCLPATGLVDLAYSLATLRDNQNSILTP